jgi:hypothetical protein
MRKRFSISVILVFICASIVLYFRAHQRQRFPYGRSHSCDKGLMFALDEYARDHNGAYPAGEESPEASLSLLYPEYANAELNEPIAYSS